MTEPLGEPLLALTVAVNVTLAPAVTEVAEALSVVDVVVGVLGLLLDEPPPPQPANVNDKAMPNRKVEMRDFMNYVTSDGIEPRSLSQFRKGGKQKSRMACA